MNINWFVRIYKLVDEIYTFLKFFLRGSFKNVGSAQLKKLNTFFLPLLEKMWKKYVSSRLKVDKQIAHDKTTNKVVQIYESEK